MLEVSVIRIAAGRTSTIAIMRIDDESKGKTEFVNPPDARTVKLLRRALDQLDEEAARV